MEAIPNVFKWRYLDSLDSIRYSTDNKNIRQLFLNDRIHQAELEISASLLMGNGITFTTNQFIDSYGLIKTLAKIIRIHNRVSTKTNTIGLPFQFALYDYRHELTQKEAEELHNPYNLVSYLLKKNGQQNKALFELSAWPLLDPDRRMAWAEIFDNHDRPIPILIGKNDEEANLASDLVLLLEFYKSEKSIIDFVKPSRDIRKEMVGYISSIEEKKIKKDELLSKIIKSSTARMEKLQNIIEIFKKLEQRKIVQNNKELSIIDSRSEIRRELIENLQEYISGTEDEVSSQKECVLDIINSIYNFATYSGTKANQDFQTEPMKVDNKWSYDELTYTLGRWTRDKYMGIHKESDLLYTTLDTYSTPNLKIEDKKIHIDDFWEEFFKIQSSRDWKISINNYMLAYNELYNTNENYNRTPKKDRLESHKKALLNSSEKYEKCRQTHIDIINKNLITSDFYIEIDKKNNKTMLVKKYEDCNTRKIQIEDFGINPLLTKEEKIKLHAGKKSKASSMGGVSD